MSNPFDGQNVIVLDLETARSAEDCRHCGKECDAHLALETTELQCPPTEGWSKVTWYESIGWDNKAALGLSMGGIYDYRLGSITWFDEHNLDNVMAELVERQPLMVSFNGVRFDFPLMRGILRRRAEASHQARDGLGLEPQMSALDMLCDDFKKLAANSYDILAELWRADPDSKFVKGLNSLDAIAQANGLGPKISHGAQAPRDWQAGKHAQVLNYCADDVMKTKALFERISLNGGEIKRGDGAVIALRWIDETIKWRGLLTV